MSFDREEAAKWMKMNPELKAKWLEALRSGNYPQGRGRLRCETGFCCIGVLADVIDPNAWKNHQGDDNGDHWKWKDHISYLPSDQEAGYGIIDAAPVLMDLNDGKFDPDTDERINTHSFAEIADIIEEFL